MDGRTQSYHSRQSSIGSSLYRPQSASQSDNAPSYVQRMRIAKGTVWAERGPKDAVNESRKQKVAQTKKRGFGIKMFQGPPPTQQARAGKVKLQPYAAAQHTTLIPRLSASEANDNDDDFDNFTSAAAGMEARRTSAAPSLARSSLRRYATSTHTSAPDLPSVPTSPSGLPNPIRMDSAFSSSGDIRTLPSMDQPFPAASSTAQFGFGSTSNFATSRSGSPTQLQQYTQQHNPDLSDEEEEGYQQPRQKLFIANADISDSD